MMPRKLRLITLATGLTSLSLLSGIAWAQGAPPAFETDVAPVPPPAASAPATDPTPAPAPAAEPAPAPAPAAAAPAAVAPAADPTSAAVEADAAAEAAAVEQLATAQNTDDGYKLDIYGFADFTYGLAVKKFAFGPSHNSFALGRLNTYLAADLGDHWKTLAEIRFSYLPHGANRTDATGQVTRIDDSVADYTDLGRTVRWGGVMIERAYLEYQAHPLLNIRAGHYLTPYGIWNVDHGSPVIIGVRRPFIVGEALFPQSQTGLELYGTHHFDPVTVGYHLTLSNGRGPIDTYQDLNGNKAIGGRLFAAADTGSAGTITLGLSGYTGRYSDETQSFGFDENGDLTTINTLTADYNEASLAADLKYEVGGLLVQGEAIMNDVVYDKLRPVDPFAIGGPPGYLPDHRRTGVYGLTGYRFAFLGTMPFAGFEYYDAGGAGFAGESAAFWGGLNVRPTARVVLKAQYTYSWFPGDPEGVPEDSHYNSIDLQAAWSF